MVKERVGTGGARPLCLPGAHVLLGLAAGRGADLARDLCDPDTLALVRATIGVGGEQGAAACRGERQRQLEAILEREQTRGKQPPTLERTTDAVLAPLYYRAVVTNEPLTPEWARTLVSYLLAD